MNGWMRRQRGQASAKQTHHELPTLPKKTEASSFPIQAYTLYTAVQ